MINIPHKHLERSLKGTQEKVCFTYHIETSYKKMIYPIIYL